MKVLNNVIAGKVRFDFHVRKEIRNKYGFEESLFSIEGNLLIPNFRLARVLAANINEVRRNEGKEDLQVSAGQLNALGLMHEIFHFLIRYYEDNINPGVFRRGLKHLVRNIGKENVDDVLQTFVEDFPPVEVYKGKKTVNQYLNNSTEGKPNREIVLEELLLLNLENMNPATVLLEELYTDKPLANKTRYLEVVDQADKFFVTEKPFGTENLPLLNFLRKPIIASPYNIEGQLEFIRMNWGVYIYEKFNLRLLKGKDLIQEDVKLFLQHGFDKPTPPVPVYKFDTDYFNKLKNKLGAGEELTDDEKRYYYSEYEKFTRDVDWMPRVVMIAKNTYVWLDQLSKKYNRHIYRLDQIPDEELDQLARWNFTGLWLIGIWERSSASRKIKQMTGNPEATSSAYSLFDYVIAGDLGGDGAFQNLKDRAWQRGIRLASDMVPNHTGIYSKWVVEKPDYFIQTEYPPYPGYSFKGPNLSEDDRVEVRIEDKYYSRTDAAVVFQRLDKYTGDVRYIYHGNDGTNMPWNDTAQLNLLKEEVRESLIQTIMHVARKFPIIRFDAAMTLAKKHYSRLWFPQPGSGGAVPSRSDYAMTREDFDKAMPQEFWREVVDRINKELPDTLLLAEAFWLMEGYFVRTLGMHRVYNSAFMHMLMKEENDKYRELIKNTLSFNPEILKRYVNFMSNPDEETAVNQFGKGDKYAGVTLMMITLPGLPMFAHGQIEGLSEKYGMEYKQAYYNEQPDEHLVKKHEEEIFPLLQKRYLFSQAENFELYDFINTDGKVIENVFAYSNRRGDEKAVILYNNSYYECAGVINYSAVKIGRDNPSVKLAEALELKNNPRNYYVISDYKTGMEYLLRGSDIHENGIYFPLSGYQYKILMNFREVYDSSGDYEQLYIYLSGNGTPSVDEALKALKLIPVHEAVQKLISPVSFNNIRSYFPDIKADVKSLQIKEDSGVNLLEDLLQKSGKLVDEITRVQQIPLEKEKIINGINLSFNALRIFTRAWVKESNKKNAPKWLLESREFITLYDGISEEENRNTASTLLVLNEIFSEGIPPKDATKGNPLFDKLLLSKPLFEGFSENGFSQENIEKLIELIKLLSSSDKNVLWQKEKTISKKSKQNTVSSKPDAAGFIDKLFEGYDASKFIFLNEYGGSIYFNKERYEELLSWLFTLINIDSVKKMISKRPSRPHGKRSAISNTELSKMVVAEVKDNLTFVKKLRDAGVQAGYRLSELKEILQKEAEIKTARKTVMRKTSNSKKKAPVKSISKKGKKKNQ